MNNIVLKSLLSAATSSGRFFTVTFVRKDGRIRTMNCRAGVRKFLKNPLRIRKTPDNIVVVFDVKAMQYRSIPKERILAIRLDRTEAAATA